MNNYRVGDEVRVKTGLEDGERYDNVTFIDEMKKYQGKVVTIARIFDEYDPIRYEIREDNGDHWWTNAMFTQSKTSNKIKITFEGTKTTATMGDKVGVARCNLNVDKYDEAEGIRIAVCRLFDIEPFKTTVIEKPINDYSVEELLNNLANRV